MSDRQTMLALDLSGIVGWAFGEIGGRRARPSAWGAWVLPSLGGLGAKLCAFENELIDALDLHAPTKVVMEAPMSIHAMNQDIVAFQQLGLAAYVWGECYRKSIPVSSADSYTIRLEVMGKGRFPKGETKQHVIAWCRAHDYRLTDHNAADAVVTWLYYAHRLQTDA